MKISHSRSTFVSQPERINPLLTGSLRQMKEIPGQFLDWTSQINLKVLFI